MNGITPFPKELIEAHMVSEAEHLHIKRLGEEEINAKEHLHFDLSSAIEDLNDQLKETKKTFKVDIDEKKKEAKEIMQQLKKGCVEMMVTAVLVPDFDNGLMHIYDKKTSELIDFRKLRPEERQFNIHQSKAN